jgi:hypothetical protein
MVTSRSPAGPESCSVTVTTPRRPVDVYRSRTAWHASPRLTRSGTTVRSATTGGGTPTQPAATATPTTAASPSGTSSR